jgi:hypothetical protein
MSNEQAKIADAINPDDPWTRLALKELDDGPRDAPIIDEPKELTAPAKLFFEDIQKSNLVLTLLTDVTIFADNASHVSRKIIGGEQSEIPIGFDPFKPISPAPGLFQRKLGYVSQPLMQMIIGRIVDNFTTYLVEILRECLKAKPQILRSKENLTYDAILQHKTMEELQTFLVERKVDELAYLGFGKLADWVDEKLGVPDLKSFPARGALVQVLETRNCIVHNRSRVGPKFLRALGREDLTFLIGSDINVSVELIYLANRSTAECVSILDGLLAKKFSLACVSPDENKKKGHPISEVPFPLRTAE